MRGKDHQSQLKTRIMGIRSLLLGCFGIQKKKEETFEERLDAAMVRSWKRRYEEEYVAMETVAFRPGRNRLDLNALDSDRKVVVAVDWQQEAVRPRDGLKSALRKRSGKVVGSHAVENPSRPGKTKIRPTFLMELYVQGKAH